jgi:DNA-binding Lrp family transcriptional regulator
MSEKETLLPLPKTSIEGLLKPINRLTESCVLKTRGSILDSLCTSSDNSVILYAVCKLPMDISESKLNIINIKKLLTGLDCLGDDGAFSLKIFPNSIKCQSKNEETGENTHFKYHLVDDGIIKECGVKIESIAALDFDTEFEISLPKIRQIMSAYSFVSDVTKIYFYTKEGKVCAEIDDKTMDNVDNVSMILSPEFKGQELEAISIKIEVFKSLVSSKYPIKVKINNAKKVFVFNTREDENVELKYIVSALVK